jgi:hypothetical protein
LLNLWSKLTRNIGVIRPLIGACRVNLFLANYLKTALFMRRKLSRRDLEYETKYSPLPKNP